ncbi:molecular chaperone [Lelliottia nimipressuralis]|uniref:fimbrial biogenesis chaperone n=1 Tax=Lelliottia nimipressuralis TaxID=69220 RepID=UPI0035560015
MRIQTALHLVLLSLVGMSSLHNALANGGQGGISLEGTRLIFDGGKDASSMMVSNSSSDDVWLMRFWISPYGDKSDEVVSDKKNVPFAVTPPLYRLDPKSAVQLRINKLSESLPADRESVYYLNSLAIPPKKGEKSYQKAVQSGLQFAVNTRIKLFYRPAAINDAAAIKAAPEKLTVTSTGKSIVVKNPTPWFVTMSQLSLDGRAVQSDKDTMISPFGELSFPISVNHGTFSFSTIDDRGMTTLPVKKIF